MAPGIQFILGLNGGVNQDGFGNYCRGFKWILLGLIAPQLLFIAMALLLLKKGNQLIGRGRKGLSTKIHLALSTGGI